MGSCPSCKGINTGEYKISLHKQGKAQEITYWMRCADCRYQWQVVRYG